MLGTPNTLLRRYLEDYGYCQHNVIICDRSVESKVVAMEVLDRHPALILAYRGKYVSILTSNKP